MKKFIPISIFGAASMIAVPLSLTSCSNVFMDLLHHHFEPSWKKQSLDPDHGGHEQYTEDTDYYKDEITQSYFNHVNSLGSQKKKDNFIKDELTWSACETSLHGESRKRTIELEKGDYSYTKFYLHISDVHFDGQNYFHQPEKENWWYLSYKMEGRMETLLDNITNLDDEPTNSYRVDRYSFELEMRHVPFDFSTITYDNGKWYQEEIYQIWELTPKKLDIQLYYNPRFSWLEFEDGEYISFSCRHFCEGYNKNGKQNYSYQADESAIIDKDHVYSPHFEVEVASFFFFDTYYNQDQVYRGRKKPLILLTNPGVISKKSHPTWQLFAYVEEGGSFENITNDVTWESSDPDIASFSEDNKGMLNIKSTGTVAITASHADYESQTITIIITD